MSEPDDLGGIVVEASRQAQTEVVLCAPFVKAATLTRVLDSIAPGVTIQVFTRWRPDEVAAGVSDTTILPLVEDRGGSVHLCDRLHAKLFRFDDRALIGSANLTASALGWAANPNLELIAEVGADLPQVLSLEARLNRDSIPASAEIAAEVERVAALLPSRAPIREDRQADADATLEAGSWHPQLREPRDLFVAYSRGSDQLSSSSASAAGADLAALDLPPGFDREVFEQVVGNRLLQAPLVLKVDELLTDSQRFGGVRDFLSGPLGLDREGASHVWQTLMRWLLYFLPHRYSRTVPSHSEILVRRQAPKA